MKNSKKNLITTICAVVGASALFSSCLKESNSSYYSSPVALVTVVQASPDEPQLDFYLDNNQINSSAISYGDNIDYFRAYTGKRNAYFYSTGTISKVASDTLTLNGNTAYSLFLTNTKANPKILVVTDSLKKPTTGNASVRFINLSPDSQPVSLAIQNVQVLVTNQAFKGYSPFIPVTGNSVYTFLVRQGTTNTVLATLANITLKAGYVYTIWYHGLTTPTNSTDGVKADIMTNAFYY
jgi:hypothetical protein